MDDSTGIVFRDVITLTLLAFVAIVIMILPHINPPGEKQKKDITPPGNILVEISWPPGNTDVDLWTMAPGDVPVGYSNKGGRIFNLLRDDLGFSNDTTELNYEVAYTRGIPAGEYVINVHMFRSSDPFPIVVDVIVSSKANETAQLKQLLTAQVELRSHGEEITAMRFTIDDDGNMVSAHALFMPLRSRRSRPPL